MTPPVEILSDEWIIPELLSEVEGADILNAMRGEVDLERALELGS